MESLHFCIGLDLYEGYTTLIEIDCNHEGPPHRVLIDYDHLLVQRHFCLSLAHHIIHYGECKWRQKENGRYRWLEQNEGIYQNAKDDDGFTRVEGKVPRQRHQYKHNPAWRQKLP